MNTDNTVEPGTRIHLAGQEYVAVAQGNTPATMHGCPECSIAQGTPECHRTSCGGVVWMTPLKLITLRITK